MNEPRKIVTPRPFLKWVGGKGQLLPELLKRVEAAGKFGRYHEPFVGGGALFFEMARCKQFGRKYAYLSDNNPRLVKAYQGIREDVDAVISALEEHKRFHGKEYFYHVRNLHNASWNTETPVECAARIIYLNKTCFNGLYRENTRGEFNVPMGTYKNPRILDEENLRAVASVLKKYAKVEERQFESVVDVAEPGDLVYFDPPYDPLSVTASFTQYAKHGFRPDDQRKLAVVAADLDSRGVNVILSNSKTRFIESIYAKDFTLATVPARRSVNSNSSKRGAVDEIIICSRRLRVD